MHVLACYSMQFQNTEQDQYSMDERQLTSAKEIQSAGAWNEDAYDKMTSPKEYVFSVADDRVSNATLSSYVHIRYCMIIYPAWSPGERYELFLGISHAAAPASKVASR